MLGGLKCLLLPQLFFPFRLNVIHLGDFKEKKKFIDTWQHSLRFQEEIILTKSDMNSVLMSTSKTINSLEEIRLQLEFHLIYEEPKRLLLAKLFIGKEETEILKKFLIEANVCFICLM